MSRALISALIERRGVLKKELDAILDAPTAEKRNLNDTEATAFEAKEAEIRQLDERVKQLTEQVERDEAAGQVAQRYGVGGAQVTSEPEVYRKGPQGTSFFRDLYMARQKGDRAAIERLDRNNRMRAEQAAKEQRAISTSNGAGGEFVPPLWLEEEFIRYVRPGRVSANLCTHGEVPPGTDSINIPKVSGGTAVAVQGTQNTGVQQTDLTTTSISSPVITIAGGQTMSLQLIEQSPLNIDEIVLQDLAMDYARYLNLQVLSGTGSGGQVTGLLTQSGTQAVTWTNASPTLAGSNSFYTKLANAIELIQTARYLPPTAIVMHPRRWAWVVSQADSQNRPAVVPDAQSPFNAAGTMSEGAPAQGRVGSMLGIPVYIDALLPTNLGAGTNQDEVYVAKMDDLWLWEGQVRAEAFQQTYAQNLSVFVRLYNYVSFQAGRYPVSIATINGTGLVAPTF